MKKEATVDEVLYAFLKELYRDTLLHPNMLQATRPDLLWEQATHVLEKQNLEITSEIQQMMTSRLYGEHCVKRVNRQDGSHLLQISEEGIALLRSMEAAAAERKKEEKDDFRWRVGTYIAVASLASGAIGFLVGWWVAKS